MRYFDFLKNRIPFVNNAHIYLSQNAKRTSARKDTRLDQSLFPVYQESYTTLHVVNIIGVATFIIFFRLGLKLGEKSIENGLKSQKCSVGCFFSRGGCHHPNG